MCYTSLDSDHQYPRIYGWKLDSRMNTAIVIMQIILLVKAKEVEITRTCTHPTAKAMVIGKCLYKQSYVTGWIMHVNIDKSWEHMM